jgi:hypothetical protein
LKADALAYGRKVDASAQVIFVKLAPIENHLSNQEKIVTDEKKRVKEEEARLFKEKIDSRHNQLTIIGVSVPYREVSMMSDEEFDEKLAAARKAFDDEQIRITENKRLEDERVAKVEAGQEAERQRLAEERVAQDKIIAKAMEDHAMAAAELAEKQAAIDKKEKAIKDEKDKLERVAFEIQAKEDAKIQARIDVLARNERLEKETAEREAAEAAEKERAEALRPDLEKFRTWADAYRDLPETPKVEDKRIRNIIYETIHNIHDILDKAKMKVEAL